MTFETKATERFLKDFDALDNSTKSRVREKIGELKANPHAYKRLHGRLKGLWSLRIGDYRVVYSIDLLSRLVILYFIGHRKRVYGEH